MKKDWKIYDRLMRLETGIGGTRSLIDASSEWWEEKIKVDIEFAKFRNTNLDIYETHYAPLFRDCIAVGDHAMTPIQFQNNSNLNDLEENIEAKGDSNEINLDDDEPLFTSFVQGSSSKRKKSKDFANKHSTKSKTSSFEEKLDVVLDALSSKSTPTFPPTNLSPTISDCMSIVITFPSFEEGSRKYSQPLRVFLKKQHREAFMFPTSNEAKMEFLKLIMEE
ncbi:hypothetical protein SSX86_033138 [Deinandra increscens subsp. villosa]|uniref:Myb/SANT-like domain-containing protein n=1 Tax=Deinandra increscens subsp. villosa TaxID=3103831 RepID=A0AAP0C5J7_9ASTR